MLLNRRRSADRERHDEPAPEAVAGAGSDASREQELLAEVGDVAEHLDDIAVASAEVSHSCDVLRARLGTQVEQTIGVRSLAAQIAGEVRAAAESIEELTSTSSEINSLARSINDIADQTTLLALNAAIEAARAGEAGLGFAVVADEVRMLANRAAASTGKIQELAARIDRSTESAGSSMRALVSQVEEGDGTPAIGEAETNIQATVSALLDELRYDVEEVDRIAVRSLDVAGKAEVIYEITGEDALSPAVRDVLAAQRTVVAQIEGLVEDDIVAKRIGIDDLFDERYQPIPGTDPTKYRTRFDAYTDEVLPPLQDPLLDRFPQLVYAACTDRNAYIPTHNTVFSKPLTGDRATDLANNRTKRIFEDRCSQRGARNTASFLLQTYKRDTGEVMQDIVVPITFGGRHWGNLRAGVTVTR